MSFSLFPGCCKVRVVKTAIQIVVSSVATVRTTFAHISQAAVDESSKQISFSKQSSGHQGPHVHLHSDGLRQMFVGYFSRKYLVNYHLGYGGGGDRLEVED